MRLRRKLTWVALLYFAEGFPFGIAYDVWPVYFRQHGVSLAEIGLMSLLFLPYTLKPAWAPLVDRLGQRQSWVIAAELGLAVMTVILLGMDPSHVGWLLWFVLLGFTLSSATQDIAIDAWAVDVSSAKDQGSINGVRVSAYRVALVAAGGLVLVLADSIGWRLDWLLVCALFLVMALIAWKSPRIARERESDENRSAAGPRLRRVRLVLVGFAVLITAIAWLQGWTSLWIVLAVLAVGLAVASFLDPTLLAWVLRREMILVVAFVLLYKVGDSALGRMVKPFWVDHGMSASEIGVVSSTVGMILTIAGALCGGWFTDRKGIFQGLLWFGIAQALSNFGYVAVAFLHLPRGGASLFGLSFGPFQAAIYGASMVESFAQGLGTAAFLAFLMNQCDRRHAATQFAMLTAVMALSRDLAGALSGIGVEAIGYGGYFTVTALLALPALAMLPWIKGKIQVAGSE